MFDGNVRMFCGRYTNYTAPPDGKLVYERRTLWRGSFYDRSSFGEGGYGFFQHLADGASDH